MRHGRREVVRREPPRAGCARRGASTRCGGVSATIAGRRFYPIQVAEKGFAAYRIAVRGTWGHGSMPPATTTPRVRAAAVIERLPSRGRRASRPVMAASYDLGRRRACRPRRSRSCDAPVGRRSATRARRPRDAACDPMYRASPARALPRHHQPGRRRTAGVEVQRHPGRRRHRGRLPDPAGLRPRPAMRADAQRRASGRSSQPSARSSSSSSGAPCRGAGRGAAVRPPGARRSATTTPTASVPGHGAVRRPDARALPTRSARRPTASRRCGSSPDERFLERFHGVDERVSVDALRVGPAGPLRRRSPLLRLRPCGDLQTRGSAGSSGG